MLWRHHRQVDLLALPDLLNFYDGRVFVECVFCLQPQPLLCLFRKEYRYFDGSLYHQSIGDKLISMRRWFFPLLMWPNFKIPYLRQLNWTSTPEHFSVSSICLFLFAGSENRFPKMNMICKKIKWKERAHSIRIHHLTKTCIVLCKNDYDLDKTKLCPFLK